MDRKTDIYRRLLIVATPLAADERRSPVECLGCIYEMA